MNMSARTKSALYLLFSSIAVVLPLNAAGIFDFFSPTQVNKLLESNKDINFLIDSIELRKRQLDDLNKQRLEVKREVEEALRATTKTLNDLNIELLNTKKSQREAQQAAGDAEVFNKKIGLLNDRTQQIINYQELLKEYETSYDDQIKWVKSVVDEFANDKQENIKEKKVFVLRDLQTREQLLNKFSVEFMGANNKKESLLRQKNAQQEKLSSLKREYEAKLKEKEKVYNQIANAEDTKPLSDVSAHLKIDVLEQEAAATKDKTDYTQLQLKKISFELSGTDDDLARLKTKVSELSSQVSYIKKHLIINAKDVTQARDEWKAEALRINTQKTKNNASKDPLRLERDRKVRELNVLNDKLKHFKDAGEEKSPQAYLLDADAARITALIKKIEMQLTLLEARNESFNAQVEQKFFVARSVQIRFKLSHVSNVESISDWISDFKARKATLEHDARAARNKREEALNSIAQTTSFIDATSKKADEIAQLRETVFKANPKMYNDTVVCLSEAQNNLREQLLLVQAYLTVVAPLIPREEGLIAQYDVFIRELDQHRLEFNIWHRSSKAISLEGFKKSILEAEFFFQQLFWATPQYLNPANIWSKAVNLSFTNYLTLLLWFLIFILLFIFMLLGAQIMYRNLLSKVAATHGRLGFLYLNIVLCCLEFIREHFTLLFTWFFILATIRSPIALGLRVAPADAAFFSAIFFLLGIPTFIYLSTKLLLSLKNLNQKLSFFFFNEQSQHKFITLAACMLYASSSLLPLRAAFLAYGTRNSELPEVILAAYSLILLVVLLLFFNKEDVLKLMPMHNEFLLWIKRGVDIYYYPVFIFFMGLFILANPYIGYSHLAWFLAFVVPITILIVSGVFICHHYIRKYSLFAFFKEEGEELVDKFEHAKMYYGFFVLFAFLALILLSFVAISHLWGFSYSVDAAWKLIAEEWTIKIGASNRLGIIQILSFTLFVISGFLLSSLSNHFLLNKLFDIFRTEPGAQNTISRILHYVILVVLTLFGLATIGLAQLILPVSYLLIFGIGLGLKDQIADFFAGFLVLLERQIEIGHFIETGDIIGTVQKIAVRSTTIRTARNLTVVIPNRTIISTPIINYSRHSVAFEIKLVVRHDSAVEVVKSILFEIVSSHPTVLRVPTPVIRLEEITELGQLFLLRGFVSPRKAREMWEVASDIRIAIINIFKSKNIRVMCSYPLKVELLDKIESIEAKVTEL